MDHTCITAPSRPATASGLFGALLRVFAVAPAAAAHLPRLERPPAATISALTGETAETEATAPDLGRSAGLARTKCDDFRAGNA